MKQIRSEFEICIIMNRHANALFIHFRILKLNILSYYLTLSQPFDNPTPKPIELAIGNFIQILKTFPHQLLDIRNK